VEKTDTAREIVVIGVQHKLTEVSMVALVRAI
jgi:hypothetical protein